MLHITHCMVRTAKAEWMPVPESKDVLWNGSASVAWSQQISQSYGISLSLGKEAENILWFYIRSICLVARSASQRPFCVFRVVAIYQPALN